MQKLLEETLLCDISSQLEPYEYGQKWSDIENHLKTIITKDNQTINKKSSEKKLVLNLNKTTTLRKFPNKLSPNQSQHSTKLYTSSIHQNAYEKKKKVRSIYYPQQLELETDFIEQQEKNHSFQAQSKDLANFILLSQKNELSKNQQQIKNQQNIINRNKEQFVVYSRIQRPYNLKSQQENTKISTIQALGKATYNQNQNFNKKQDSQGVVSKSLKKDGEKKMYRKNPTWHQYQNSIIVTNCKIKRSDTINNDGKSQKIRIKNSRNNRAKTEHKYLQIKNVCILLDIQKNDQLQRLNQNQNYKLVKSSQDYKKQINQFKNHIFQQEFNTPSNVYMKRYQFNKDSNKSLQQKSIILPLLGRPFSENKKEKNFTNREGKAFTFSQSRNSSQQKSKSKQRNQLMLAADKKSVQSIKLVVKKQKKTEQSSVSNSIFQEIDMENNQQNGAIRKLKLSQIMSGRLLLNVSTNLKQNSGYLTLNRDRNSKSCLMKTKQIISSPLSTNKKSQQQSLIKPRQLTNKRSLFFCNKNQNSLQKSVRHSNEKPKYSTQKLQKIGKQNVDKTVNKKNQANISLIKLQLNKHQSKLVIIKK